MQTEYLRMADTEAQSRYPRPLRQKELDLLEFVLPADRSGYREYRDLLKRLVVLSQGRRGKGNLVLGFANDIADITSPLAPVVAYGMVETTRDMFSITVREYVGKQIDVEIVSTTGEEVSDHFEEKRRWTYSSWAPGDASPATGGAVREVTITGDLVLAIAWEDRRLWVHDGRTGMNLPIPITNFYNELMLHKNIRDPKIALVPGLFFDNLSTYADFELRAAFVAYNKLMRKVELVAQEAVVAERGMKAWFHQLLRRRRA